MLDEIIKFRLSKISDNSNEDIKEVNEKYNILLNKLKAENLELYKNIDFIIGEFISTYSSLFFELGFKDGLKLSNEIKMLK